MLHGCSGWIRFQAKWSMVQKVGSGKAFETFSARSMTVSMLWFRILLLLAAA